jgi:hypothetical protein
VSLRDTLSAAVARCAPIPLQHATTAPEHATADATIVQQPERHPGVLSPLCNTQRNTCATNLLRAPLKNGVARCTGIGTQHATRATRRAPENAFRLSRAEADRCHAEPWDDATCARFVARVTLFLRRGIGASDADDLAEALAARDRDHDDRRLCAECRHGRAQRCPDGAPLPLGVLHRCAVFVPDGLAPHSGEKG